MPNPFPELGPPPATPEEAAAEFLAIRKDERISEEAFMDAFHAGASYLLSRVGEALDVSMKPGAAPEVFFAELDRQADLLNAYLSRRMAESARRRAERN